MKKFSKKRSDSSKILTEGENILDEGKKSSLKIPEFLAKKMALQFSKSNDLLGMKKFSGYLRSSKKLSKTKQDNDIN